jgi:hypothetical protein
VVAQTRRLYQEEEFIIEESKLNETPLRLAPLGPPRPPGPPESPKPLEPLGDLANLVVLDMHLP